MQGSPYDQALHADGASKVQAMRRKPSEEAPPLWYEKTGNNANDWQRLSAEQRKVERDTLENELRNGGKLRMPDNWLNAPASEGEDLRSAYKWKTLTKEQQREVQRRMKPKKKVGRPLGRKDTKERKRRAAEGGVDGNEIDGDRVMKKPKNANSKKRPTRILAKRDKLIQQVAEYNDLINDGLPEGGPEEFLVLVMVTNRSSANSKGGRQKKRADDVHLGTHTSEIMVVGGPDQARTHSTFTKAYDMYATCHENGQVSQLDSNVKFTLFNNADEVIDAQTHYWENRKRTPRVDHDIGGEPTDDDEEEEEEEEEEEDSQAGEAQHVGHHSSLGGMPQPPVQYSQYGHQMQQQQESGHMGYQHVPPEHQHLHLPTSQMSSQYYTQMNEGGPSTLGA